MLIYDSSIHFIMTVQYSYYSMARQAIPYYVFIRYSVAVEKASQFNSIHTFGPFRFNCQGCLAVKSVSFEC